VPSNSNEKSQEQGSPTMKSVAVILLLLLIMVAGVPLMMSMDHMGTGWCPGCLSGDSAHQVGLCLSLAASILVIASLTQGLGATYLLIKRSGRIPAFGLFRPPRAI
jgi:hypothetical protein